MQQKREILVDIHERMEDPLTVMRDFFQWCLPAPDGLVFWSKPSHFDYMFISSYARDLELMNPFDFRTATDMRSFIKGLYSPAPVPKLEVPFEGDAHNAIFDTLHQIKELAAHVEKAAA